jgi:hypothetical protein
VLQDSWNEISVVPPLYLLNKSSHMAHGSSVSLLEDPVNPGREEKGGTGETKPNHHRTQKEGDKTTASRKEFSDQGSNDSDRLSAQCK